MIAQVRSFQTHPTRATEVKSTRKHVCCVRLRRGHLPVCSPFQHTACTGQHIHADHALCLDNCPYRYCLRQLCAASTGPQYSIPKPATSSPPLQHWRASLGKILLLLYKNDEDVGRKIRLLTLGRIIELTSSTQGA